MQPFPGKPLADAIFAELRTRETPKKFLAVVLVGDDQASFSFVQQKKKRAEELGVDFREYHFPATSTTDFLREQVGRIARQRPCGGVIVQLPLPAHINRHSVCNGIPQNKDVDVLSERTLGSFYTGRNPVLPPAVATFDSFISAAGIDLSKKTVAVVGVGFLVGKPISQFLQGRASEILVLDVGFDPTLLQQADVVVCCAGVAHLITPNQLKSDAVVIDFGYSKNASGELCGDFQPPTATELENGHGSYTPTPGGTGPVLVAHILRNFYILQ